MQLITGNTYPVRSQLKALGGTWDAAAQGWRVPNVLADAARKIVESAGPAQPREATSRSRRSGYTRFNSGAEVFRNVRGRCEDAPCCGCCS